MHVARGRSYRGSPGTEKTSPNKTYVEVGYHLALLIAGNRVNIMD